MNSLGISSNPSYVDTRKYFEIEKLADELLLRIFSFLTYKELTQLVHLTSRRWSRVGKDNFLWKRYFQVKFPGVEPSISKEKTLYIDLIRRRLGSFSLDYIIKVGARVYSLLPLSDGTLACGAYRTPIGIWSVETRKFLKFITNKKDIFLDLISLLEGKIVSRSLENAVRVWDIKTGKCLKQLTEHKDRIESVCVLPNGQVACGSRDGTIRIWK